VRRSRRFNRDFTTSSQSRRWKARAVRPGCRLEAAARGLQKSRSIKRRCGIAEWLGHGWAHFPQRSGRATPGRLRRCPSSVVAEGGDRPGARSPRRAAAAAAMARPFHIDVDPCPGSKGQARGRPRGQVPPHLQAGRRPRPIASARNGRAVGQGSSSSRTQLRLKSRGRDMSAAFFATVSDSITLSRSRNPCFLTCRAFDELVGCAAFVVPFRPPALRRHASGRSSSRQVELFQHPDPTSRSGRGRHCPAPSRPRTSTVLLKKKSKRHDRLGTERFETVPWAARLGSCPAAARPLAVLEDPARPPETGPAHSAGSEEGRCQRLDPSFPSPRPPRTKAPPPQVS